MERKNRHEENLQTSEDRRASSQGSRSYRRGLSAIFATAVALRAIVVWRYLMANPFAGTPVNDAEVYWRWAGEIARGQLVLEGRPFFSAPFYPYVLGLLRAFGAHLGDVLVLQSVLVVVAAWALAFVVRRRFGERMSLWVAGLFLLLLEPVSSALRILPSAWHLVFVVGAYAAIVGLQEDPGRRRALVAGIAIGVLVLAYSPALLLLPIFGTWAAFSAGRERLRIDLATILVVAASIFLLAPAIHNWKAVGELIPLQSGSGMTLLQGNQAHSRGGYTGVSGISRQRDRMHEDAQRSYRQETGRPGSWREVDRHFRDRAVSFWTSHPGRALRLAARKLAYFVTSKNYAEIYSPQSEIRLGIQRSFLASPLAVPWILGVALVGVWSFLRQPRRYLPELVLFALPLLVVVVFFYSPRYRLPALPMVIVAAAYALDRAWSRDARVGYRLFVGAALLFGLTIGPLQEGWGFDRPMDATQAKNLAFVLSEQGRYGEAVSWQRRGIELGGGDALAYLDLGTLLKQAGFEEEGLEAYIRSLTMAPFRLDFTLSLSRDLMALQRYSDVEKVLQVAQIAHPESTELLRMLAAARARQGKMAGAAEAPR